MPAMIRIPLGGGILTIGLKPDEALAESRHGRPIKIVPTRSLQCESEAALQLTTFWVRQPPRPSRTSASSDPGRAAHASQTSR